MRDAFSIISCPNQALIAYEVQVILVDFLKSTDESIYADVVQLAEQLFCKHQVRGSIPLISS